MGRARLLCRLSLDTPDHSQLGRHIIRLLSLHSSMLLHCSGMLAHFSGMLPHCGGLLPHCSGMLPHCGGMIPHQSSIIPHCSGMAPYVRQTGRGPPSRFNSGKGNRHEYRDDACLFRVMIRAALSGPNVYGLTDGPPQLISVESHY